MPPEPTAPSPEVPKPRPASKDPPPTATRHGLYSAKLPADHICESQFRELLPNLIAAYQPATPIERRIVETMARAIARICWTWRASAEIFTREQDPESTTASLVDIFDRNASLLDRLDRLERRFTRQWRNAAALLARREN